MIVCTHVGVYSFASCCRGAASMKFETKA